MVGILTSAYRVLYPAFKLTLSLLFSPSPFRPPRGKFSLGHGLGFVLLATVADMISILQSNFVAYNFIIYICLFQWRAFKALCMNMNILRFILLFCCSVLIPFHFLYSSHAFSM